MKFTAQEQELLKWFVQYGWHIGVPEWRLRDYAIAELAKHKKALLSHITSTLEK